MSYSHLTLQERYVIYHLVLYGLSYREIGRMRHVKGHNIHGSISCEVIRAFIKERLFHCEEIELPLNWAYVASGKI